MWEFKRPHSIRLIPFFECIAIHGRHAQGVRAEIGTLIIHAGRPEMESAVFLEADKAADNLPVLFYDDKTNQIAAKTAKQPIVILANNRASPAVGWSNNTTGPVSQFHYQREEQVFELSHRCG